MTTRLTAGDPAPAFTLPDRGRLKLVSLADFAGERVIVYFYPAAMTAGCTTQAVDFTAAIDELSGAGPVLGDLPGQGDEAAQVPREHYSVGFPLLSDVDKTVLGAYGAYGEKLLYGKLVEGVIRSTFVVDVDEAGRRDDRHRPVQRQGYRARRQASSRAASEPYDVSPRRRPVGALAGRSGGIGRHAGFRFLCLRV